MVPHRPSSSLSLSSLSSPTAPGRPPAHPPRPSAATRKRREHPTRTRTHVRAHVAMKKKSIACSPKGSLPPSLKNGRGDNIKMSRIRDINTRACAVQHSCGTKPYECLMGDFNHTDVKGFLRSSAQRSSHVPPFLSVIVQKLEAHGNISLFSGRFCNHQCRTSVDAVFSNPKFSGFCS